MIDIVELNTVQDKIFSNPTYQPRDVDGDEITYCNLASLAVAQGVGCHELDRAAGLQPWTADEIYNVLRSSKLFAPQAIRACQALVNQGVLIFAILPSYKLGQSHGHICTVTTGEGDYSGRWNAGTPFVMNLGRTGTCFRRKGVNWAFQTMPEFYSWGTYLSSK